MVHDKKRKRGKEPLPHKERSWKGVSVIVLLLAGIGFHMLFVSSYFQVKTIRWQGVQRLDSQSLNKQFRSVLGQSLIYLDVSELQATMLTHPWVKAVLVRKVLPNQIDVLITERVPVAVEIDPKNNKQILRDSEGVILEEEGNEAKGLPRVIHYEATAYQKARLLMPLLSGRPDTWIDLADARDLRVYFPHEHGSVRFGDRDYQKRWERFTAIEKDLHRRLIVPWEADLRFPSKVVVRAGKRGVPLGVGASL